MQDRKKSSRDRKRGVRQLPPGVFDIVQYGGPRLPVAPLQDADVGVELVLTHQQQIIKEQRRHVVIRRDKVVPLREQSLPQGLGPLLLVAGVAVQDGADDVVTCDVHLLASGRRLFRC